ncbi:hypothetical protein [Phocaeicola dorei]|uniref:hypothetical protein n=1 Tax=Phocaeicola dorei TaxID=357276 RepID=UPI00300378EC
MHGYKALKYNGKKKKSLVEKSPVKLRQRKLRDGRLSLFLDRSVDGGHEYEFLKLSISCRKLIPSRSVKMPGHSAKRKTSCTNARKP